MDQLKLPDYCEKNLFSPKISFLKAWVSARTEKIFRWFQRYFPPKDYLICEISVWRFRVEKDGKWYIFQMYTDEEMQNFAEKYFYPALSHYSEWWVRPNWYWNQAPEHVSWGWYFIWENSEKILTNPFR